MREMSPEMAALLKSKTMIGDNRPTHEVVLGGGARDFINPLISNTIVKKTLGKDGESGESISNPCVTTDGRFAFAWTKTDKKIYIAYDDDESFFYDDYTFDSVIETDIPELINFNVQHTSLFRRDDGKVLLFVNDRGNTATSSVKVYISNNGNCDDFIYYTTILEVAFIPSYNNKAECFMNVPLQIKIENGKRLIVTFANGTEHANQMVGCVYSYYSDDDGLTWVKGLQFNRLHYTYHIGQIAQTKKGTLFCEIMENTGAVSMFSSDDNGQSFTNLGVYYTGVSGAWSTKAYAASLYFDILSNTMFRITPAIYEGSYIWRLENPTNERMSIFDNWEQVAWIQSNPYTSVQIVTLPSKKMAISWCDNSDSLRTIILGMDYNPKKLKARSININRTNGMSSGLTVVLDNKDGVLAPDKEGDYHQVLWPNKEIIIRQGYGDEVIQTYKGLIDNVNMETFPAEITINSRDNLKRALDQTITASLGEDEVHVITALDTPVENLWRDLAEMAGLQIGTVEETGITITEKVFSWETYGDAFSWLSDLVGFEVVCDEEGITHFRKQQIPMEPEISYVFTEGVDIISLGYTIDDVDLYRWIIVHGKKTIKTIDEKGKEKETDEVIEFKKEFSAANYWNLLPQKILKIDAPEADTLEKCEQIALKAEYLMISRARIVKFRSVGIPHLQVGDFIQVTESSTTISEVYRITDLSSSQDSDTYTLDITCHWYSAAEEVEE